MQKKNLLILIAVIAVSAIIIAVYYNSTISGMGVVINKNTECIETDFGLNYFEKGKVVYGDNIFEDKCKAEDIVEEYSCEYSAVSKLWHPAAESYRCRDGCVNGACIKGPISAQIP